MCEVALRLYASHLSFFILILILIHQFVSKKLGMPFGNPKSLGFMKSKIQRNSITSSNNSPPHHVAIDFAGIMLLVCDPVLEIEDYSIWVVFIRSLHSWRTQQRNELVLKRLLRSPSLTSGGMKFLPSPLQVGTPFGRSTRSGRKQFFFGKLFTK